MWARKTSMHSADLKDTAPWEFTHILKSQSMYNYLIEDLMSADGFVRKEMNVIEDKTGQYYSSLIVFKDKETFDTYMDRDEIASIYETVRIIAAQKGIELTVTNEEV